MDCHCTSLCFTDTINLCGNKRNGIYIENRYNAAVSLLPCLASPGPPLSSSGTPYPAGPGQTIRHTASLQLLPYLASPVPPVSLSEPPGTLRDPARTSSQRIPLTASLFGFCLVPWRVSQGHQVPCGTRSNHQVQRISLTASLFGF